MVRVLIHVEGETEETFIREVLAPELYRAGYHAVGARLLGNARQRIRRGGIKGWNAVRGDVLRHLLEDQGCLVTTMVDYYALPHVGIGAWPGRAEAIGKPFADKAATVQAALAIDIATEMGAGFRPERFIPFVVMHEFEGLLFSDCEAFSKGIGRPELREGFQAIRDAFSCPEEINDSPVTAPSKRVVALAPEYQKPLFGSLAALEIGLDKMCAACPNFCGWIEDLRSRVPPVAR